MEASSSCASISNASPSMEGTNLAPNQSINEVEAVADRNEEEESNPFEKKKRKKTSAVWLEFKEIELADGTKKAECIYCKSRLAIVGSGVTSHFARHLKVCTRRKVNKRSQQTLSFEPLGSSSEANNVVNFKYDHAKMRESVAQFILMNEHSFNIVEQDGFNMMIMTATPFYQKISRATVKGDCVAIYEREKKKLKALLKGVRKISLTTDLWKSGQHVSYMVLTGHFIDADWKLQKRVLSFIDVPPPHGGVDIADAIYKCLTEWQIEDKVITISVDNASYNDLAIKILMENFSRSKKLFLGGRIFHVRCCAHILNLLVQDGMGEIKDVIENVRESVKFINQSEARLKKFSEIVHQLRLPARKLILDCPTRWNSTFDMLVAAIKVRDAFPRFKERDPAYRYLPSLEDWVKAENICKILQAFNTTTKLISGSEYPTSNLFLSEVYQIKEILNENSINENDYIRAMVRRMKEKFDKYWGACNLLMSIASILDPRCKMRLVEFCFPLIYPTIEAQRHVEKVRDALYELYNEYVAIHATIIEQTIKESGQQSNSSSWNDTHFESGQPSGWSKFDQFIRTVETCQPMKSDLDVYLEENVYRSVEGGANFDALEWWRLNNLKYQILSKMACDILAIPISTVASESTFSAGGRVIDTYRASLATDTVQALICGGDWLRHIRGMKKKSSKDVSKTIEISLQIP